MDAILTIIFVLKIRKCTYFINNFRVVLEIVYLIKFEREQYFLRDQDLHFERYCEVHFLQYLEKRKSYVFYFSLTSKNKIVMKKCRPFNFYFISC